MFSWLGADVVVMLMLFFNTFLFLELIKVCFFFVYFL